MRASRNAGAKKNGEPIAEKAHRPIRPFLEAAGPSGRVYEALRVEALGQPALDPVEPALRARFESLGLFGLVSGGETLLRAHEKLRTIRLEGARDGQGVWRWLLDAYKLVIETSLTVYDFEENRHAAVILTDRDLRSGFIPSSATAGDNREPARRGACASCR